MLNSITEKLIAKILSVGAACTTIFIVSGSVTDPVNAPKLVVLGVIGTAGIAIFTSSKPKSLITSHRIFLIVILVFLISMLIAVFSSNSPLSQNFYGSYGRNNGFLTYLFLIFVLISSLSLRSRQSFDLLVKSLLFAGVVNIIYCFWVIAFGDFVGWSNPYGNILGTLGNPNFIGSFLGIFLSAALAYGIGSNASKKYKLSLLIILPLTAFEIVKSHAIQGLVVAAIGCGIVGFIFVRSRLSLIVSYTYATLFGLAGFIALLGALQIGPLAGAIYKTSVSLRGQYWLAAWNTGSANPFTGVGMDAFGDWYRRARGPHALELPGVNTTVNAAHNVPLDMFAFGGWPLFVSYLLIISIGAISAIRFILRTRSYDPIFVALVTAWVGYQVQSIISINQIGLAVWGWLLTGALVAYEIGTRDTTVEPLAQSNKIVNKRRAEEHQSATVLFGALGGMVGLLLALPPLTADAKWRSAQQARTEIAIAQSMQQSLFNPGNSMKYANNVISLSQAQLLDQAHKYSLEAVKWNPDSFELWRINYFMTNSSEVEKKIALRNMKRLDPLNPDVRATP